MKQLEKERKFLVESPESWINFSELFDNLIDIKRIEQTYLEPDGDEPSARVRKTTEGLSGEENIIYHFNKKKFVEKGVNQEEEYEINKSEYENHLKNCHPDKVEVSKTRFVFDYNDQTFELDVFKGPLKGLAILEIEMADINENVELPEFLKVIKEVTGEAKYNNFELSNKSLHDKLKDLI